ncbi:MAG: hypothetical protein AVDCRST_MAG64-3616, partial [uncultured Phycisphaerae bacterium]
ARVCSLRVPSSRPSECFRAVSTNGPRGSSVYCSGLRRCGCPRVLDGPASASL